MEYPFYHIINKLDDAISAVRLANQEYNKQKESTGLSPESVVGFCEVRLNAKVLQEKVSLLIAELAPLSLS